MGRGEIENLLECLRRLLALFRLQISHAPFVEHTGIDVRIDHGTVEQVHSFGRMIVVHLNNCFDHRYGDVLHNRVVRALGCKIINDFQRPVFFAL